MHKLQQYRLPIIVFSIIALLVTGLGVRVWLLNKPPLPAAIRNQLDFVAVYPSKDSEVATDTRSIKYDSKERILSFSTTVGGAPVVFTQQATPEPFSDIPGYYDKVIERMNGYRTIDTYNGKVDLTRPVDLHGEQVAVFNSKGTLTFAHATKDVTESQWRSMFNNIDYLK